MVLLDEGIDEAISYLTTTGSGAIGTFSTVLDPLFPDESNNIDIVAGLNPQDGRTTSTVAGDVVADSATSSSDSKTFILTSTFTDATALQATQAISLFVYDSNFTTFIGFEFEDPNISEEVDIVISSALVMQQDSGNL